MTAATLQPASTKSQYSTVSARKPASISTNLMGGPRHLLAVVRPRREAPDQHGVPAATEQATGTAYVGAVQRRLLSRCRLPPSRSAPASRATAARTPWRTALTPPRKSSHASTAAGDRVTSMTTLGAAQPTATASGMATASASAAGEVAHRGAVLGVGGVDHGAAGAGGWPRGEASTMRRPRARRPAATSCQHDAPPSRLKTTQAPVRWAMRPGGAVAHARRLDGADSHEGRDKGQHGGPDGGGPRRGDGLLEEGHDEAARRADQRQVRQPRQPRPRVARPTQEGDVDGLAVHEEDRHRQRRQQHGHDEEVPEGKRGAAADADGGACPFLLFFPGFSRWSMSAEKRRMGY